MNPRSRSLAAVLGLLLLSLLVPAAAASVMHASASPSAAQPASVPAAARPSAVVVSPDPAHDLYIGTGGLVVPARHWGGSTGDRARVAECADCQWRISTLCTKAEAASGWCRTRFLGCPVGTTPARVWLSHGDGIWEVVGPTCQGPNPPKTLDQVGAEVHDAAQAALPPLRAGAQPADGVLVGLPAVYRTGQPASGITGADLSVVGLDVALDSRVRWHWTFGDGSDTWTAKPGGVWPDASVSHVYRRATTARVSVQAVWRAQYVVEGLGPYAVPGPPLTQTQAVTVVVRPAHAHLVG